jgi:hypothetical protein
MDQARRELIEMLARAAYEAIVAARQNAPKKSAEVNK